MATNFMTRSSAPQRRLSKQYRRTRGAKSLRWCRKLEKLSGDELRAKTNGVRERLARDEAIDDLLTEAFAVRARGLQRIMKMRHFDVQMIGGIALHQGKIAR